MIDGLVLIAGGSRGRALRVAPGSRRRAPHRPAPDARLQPAAAHGGRRQPRLRHRDERRLGRRIPRAPRREPAPRDGPRAVHRGRGARRRRSPRSSSRRTSSSSCSPRSSSTSPSTMVRRRDPAPENVERPAAAAADRGRGRRGQLVRRPRCRARATASGTSASARSGSVGAGVMSALLGIGGGLVKVPVMHVAHGRAAPRRDGDEQPDDRHHGVGQRDHLPAPRRDRPVRRRRRPRSASSSAPASARGSPTGSTSGSCAACSSRSCFTLRGRCSNEPLLDR